MFNSSLIFECVVSVSMVTLLYFSRVLKTIKSVGSVKYRRQYYSRILGYNKTTVFLSPPGKLQRKWLLSGKVVVPLCTMFHLFLCMKYLKTLITADPHTQLCSGSFYTIESSIKCVWLIRIQRLKVICQNLFHLSFVIPRKTANVRHWNFTSILVKHVKRIIVERLENDIEIRIIPLNWMLTVDCNWPLQ